MPGTKSRSNTKSKQISCVREPGTKYWELARRFPLIPIESDEQLDAAIDLLNELIDRDQAIGLSKDELDYMNVLGDIVKVYEDIHIPSEHV